MQAKLEVGPAGDRYEQEADRVAKQVARKLEGSEPGAGTEEIGATISPLVQRQAHAGAAPVGSLLEENIHRALGGGRALSDDVRGPMERAFGADFSGVRVHTGGEADSLGRSLGARAFTTGRDIFVRSGEYAPGNPEGRALLAHELTHVVQQGGAGASGGSGTVAQRAGYGVVQRVIKVGEEWIYDEYERGIDAVEELMRRLEPEISNHARKQDYLRLMDIVAARRNPGQARQDIQSKKLNVPDSRLHLRKLLKMLDTLETTSTSVEETKKVKVSEPVQQPSPRSISNEGPKSGQSPPKAAAFTVEPVTTQNRDEVLKVLEGWLDHASKWAPELAKERRESVNKRRALKSYTTPEDDYYAEKNKDFRQEHKRISMRAKHMSGAENEAKELHVGLKKTMDRDLPEKFKIARGSGGKIEGVIELVSRGTFIANLATNPYNIHPPSSDYKPQKGAAQALIGSVIAANKANNWHDDIGLYALNNTVKQIYDYFGFRVISKEEDEARHSSRTGTVSKSLPPRLDRPDRPKVKTKENPKTEWHKLPNMRMAPKEAKAFMKKVQKDGWIEIPPEIEKWMNE